MFTLSVQLHERFVGKSSSYMGDGADSKTAREGGVFVTESEREFLISSY
jgi:hypothetical protein